MYPGWQIKTSAFHMTDQEFEKFCAENREIKIERDAQGNIWLMSPTYSETGEFNSIILIELGIWNKQHQLGRVFDSSTGFTLSNMAMRSPDAAWISNEKWLALSDEERKGFAKVCPEFIVELRSETDHLPQLRKKMQEWLDNGCQLAWLVNLDDREVEIYRPEKEKEWKKGFDQKLSGDPILPGFEFDLEMIKK